MKYRQFATKFWRDSYISKLSLSEKAIFNYLVTNEKVNMSGIYELSDRYICFDLGITSEELEVVKNKFEKDRKIAFFKDWIYLINFGRNNQFSSAQNVVTAFMKEFNTIPLEIKQHFFKELNLPYEIPIMTSEKIQVTVMDKVMVTVRRVGGTLGDELSDKDLDEIDEGIKNKYKHN